MHYSEHPSYGEENCNDKVVVVKLDKALTAREWDVFYDGIPDPIGRFSDLDYCDGSSYEDGVEASWEKTDICPRGLVGCIFKGNEIRIWATEAITADYFLEVVRYTLSEVAKDEFFKSAQVLSVVTEGVSFSCSGIALKDVAATMHREKPPSDPQHASGRPPKKPGL